MTTRSERTRRSGLVLAYTVITVWAQAGDRHGHDKPAEVACDATCLDPSPHYSGHPAPERDPFAGDCALCQVRSNLHTSDATLPAQGGRIIEPVRHVEPVAVIAAVGGIPSSRGPPSA